MSQEGLRLSRVEARIDARLDSSVGFRGGSRATRARRWRLVRGCCERAFHQLASQVDALHLDLFLQLLVLLLDLILLLDHLVQLITHRLVSLLFIFELVTQIRHDLRERHLCQLCLLTSRELHVRSSPVIHEFGALPELSN